MLVFHVTDGIVPKIKCRRSGNALASCPPCLINKRSLSDKWTSYLLFLFFLKSTNSWKLTGIVTLWSMWQKKKKLWSYSFMMYLLMFCINRTVTVFLLVVLCCRWHMIVVLSCFRSHFASVGKADLCFWRGLWTVSSWVITMTLLLKDMGRIWDNLLNYFWFPFVSFVWFSFVLNAVPIFIGVPCRSSTLSFSTLTHTQGKNLNNSVGLGKGTTRYVYLAF